MKYKKTLKFTLCTLLLAAGVTAYAEVETEAEANVVTLGDNKTQMTWSEFVKAVNNPSTIKGNITDLQDDDEAKAAYDKANKELSDASTALDNAEKTESEKETALDNAKLSTDSNGNKYADKLETAKNTLATAEENLAKWKNDLVTYNNDVTRYSGLVTQLSSQLEDAKGDLNDAKDAYDAVGTTTETTTTTIVEWLDNIYTKSQTCLNAWNLYITSADDVDYDIELYYKITSTKKGNRYVYALQLAFEKPEAYDTDDWKTALTTGALLDALYPENINDGNGYVFSSISINIGSNKINFNNVSAPTSLSLSNVPTNDDLIIQNAVNELRNLTQTSGYYSTTVTSSTTYNDPEGELEKAVNAAQAEVNRLSGERKTANSNLSTANENVATTQGNIDGYTITKGEDGLTEQGRLNKAVEDAQNAYDSAIETAQNEYDAAVEDVVKKTDEKNVAQTAFDAAEKNAQTAANAAAREYYNVITLTGNVDPKDVITKEYAGTIKGNGYVINVPSGKVLFDTFTGNLREVAINNGAFASSYSKATFEKVAVNSSTGYRFYDDHAILTTFDTLGELGFKARDYFGVDNNILAKLGDATKVYSVTVYNADKTTKTHYVQIKDQDLYDVDATTTLNLDNKFAKSATGDVAGLNLVNVYYGVNNVCDNVVITDKENFYCPADITATNLQYGRSFSKGQNAVCLPFALTVDVSDKLTSLCKYDGETTEKFWFTKVSESIPANTPALLVVEEGFTLNNLHNITIKKTEEQIIMDEGNKEDPSKSYGLLRQCSRSEIAGEMNSHKVYGMAGGQFRLAADNANFPAFRMVLLSGYETASGNARRIGILDENGVEITEDQTGVESVKNDASSLNVTAGQGEICFTSEADFGNVAIYTQDGKVATIAKVTAGTTTVNVQKGLYIVMGKKVMVK